jgi:hypothetical protein
MISVTRETFNFQKTAPNNSISIQDRVSRGTACNANIP